MRKHLTATLGSLYLVFMLICPAQAETLTVSTGINDALGISLFESRHSDVKLETKSNANLYSEIAGDFLSRSDSIDVYQIGTREGCQQRLRKKGFFMDVSGEPVIRDFVDQMAPVFQRQLTEGDAIAFVPSFLLFEYPVLLNREIAEELGLSQDELPRNLLELLRFVNQWEEKYGDDYPEYASFSACQASSYALGHRNPYIGIVLEMYKDTMLSQSGVLRYNTPLFLELLKEIEPWTREAEPDEAGWEPELSGENSLFYAGQYFAEDMLTQICGTGKLVDMPLAEGYAPVQAYELECGMINPATRHAALAVELLRCYVEDCSPGLKRILCPNIKEPYQSPNYQTDLAALKEWKTVETRKLMQLEDTAKQEQKSLLRLIDEAILYEEQHPYLISAEAMEEYRNRVVPYLIPRGEGVYESETIYADTMSYTTRWLDGALSAEAYAKALDAFILLAALEDGQ